MRETDIDAVPVPEIREKVAALEKQMLAMPQVEMSPVHHYAEGLYGRELTIPAGVCIVGKVHKAEHLNVLLEGDITVFTEDGMKRLQAPAVMRSAAGMKRVGFTHARTTWLTVHAVSGAEEMSIEQLEEHLAVDTMDDYDAFLATATRELLQGGES